ncbi:MAG: hypothetical protein ACJ8FY_23890 [Gemmataceae bacterium]
MKCNEIHAWLLGCERPDRLPADLAAHVAECASCRAWQRRLLRLERLVRSMPAPVSTAKAEFVRDFVGGMPLGEELESIREWNAEEDAREAFANTADDHTAPATLIDGWKLATVTAAIRAALEAPRVKLHQVPAPARRRVATVLAAALLLFAFSFWSAGPNSPFNPPAGKPKPGPDPFLARLVQHEVKLAAATEPKVKILALADMADDLRRTQQLPEEARVEDLDRMAMLYEKVVLQSIMKQAESVPDTERADLLSSIADRLDQARDEARVQALEASALRRNPLNKISAAANQGQDRLRRLIGRKS